MIKTIVLFALVATSGHSNNSEETCFLLRGASKVDVPGMSVIRQTLAGPFNVSAAQHGDAVMCHRDYLLPQINDFKVLIAGFPLVISSKDGRVATLEIDSGHVQFRTLRGEFTASEIPVVRNYLDTAQETIDADSQK